MTEGCRGSWSARRHAESVKNGLLRRGSSRQTGPERRKGRVALTAVAAQGTEGTVSASDGNFPSSTREQRVSAETKGSPTLGRRQEKDAGEGMGKRLRQEGVERTWLPSTAALLESDSDSETDESWHMSDATSEDSVESSRGEAIRRIYTRGSEVEGEEVLLAREGASPLSGSSEDDQGCLKKPSLFPEHGGQAPSSSKTETEASSSAEPPKGSSVGDRLESPRTQGKPQVGASLSPSSSSDSSYSDPSASPPSSEVSEREVQNRSRDTRRTAVPTPQVSQEDMGEAVGSSLSAMKEPFRRGSVVPSRASSSPLPPDTSRGSRWSVLPTELPQSQSSASARAAPFSTPVTEMVARIPRREAELLVAVRLEGERL